MPEEGIALRERAHFMSAEELIEISKVFIQVTGQIMRWILPNSSGEFL